MRRQRRRLTAIAAAVLLAAGTAVAAGTAATAQPTSAAMTAPLSGAEEVPPVDTTARGMAIFKLDGDELNFSLNVANLHNITMAHIHLAPAGANGPVVVWLYPSAPPPQPIPGRTSGNLASGTITDADLVGLLEGQTVGDLVEHIRAGNAYVNVHTEAYPAGEIRGQIRAHGPSGG